MIGNSSGRFIGCFLIVVGFCSGPAVHGEGTLPVHELKRGFYEALRPGEIVKVLTTLEQQMNLNDVEKGARYRWEHIPVDRNPPRELGVWWRRLTPAEKDHWRLRWFHRNAMELDVDRVAHILELRERLQTLQQKILEARSQESVKLNPIPALRGTPDAGADTRVVTTRSRSTEVGMDTSTRTASQGTAVDSNDTGSPEQVSDRSRQVGGDTDT